MPGLTQQNMIQEESGDKAMTETLEALELAAIVTVALAIIAFLSILFTEAICIVINAIITFAPHLIIPIQLVAIAIPVTFITAYAVIRYDLV